MADKGIIRRLPVGIRSAAISLFLFGLLIMAAWYWTNDGSTMSSLLMLIGLSVIVLAFLLYFLTPDRYLRSEVADALALPNTLNTGRLLSSLLVESGGIYLPESGLMRVFIPISARISDQEIEALEARSETLAAPAAGVKGVSLIPPGEGLFRCSRKIGAVFTPEGLENEIKDVLENGLELAASVDVRREGDRVGVTMRGLADRGLCAAVRKEQPGMCTQIGCPICSFVGCMVVSGTGRRARIEKVNVNKDEVTITYNLI
jgi:hypothetical protein